MKAMINAGAKFLKKVLNPKLIPINIKLIIFFLFSVILSLFSVIRNSHKISKSNNKKKCSWLKIRVYKMLDGHNM